MGNDLLLRGGTPARTRGRLEKFGRHYEIPKFGESSENILWNRAGGFKNATGHRRPGGGGNG
jgi:hypothetical protein